MNSTSYMKGMENIYGKRKTYTAVLGIGDEGSVSVERPQHTVNYSIVRRVQEYHTKWRLYSVLPPAPQ